MVVRMESKIQRVCGNILLLGATAAVAALVYAFWNRWAGLTDAHSWRDAFLYYCLPLSAMAAALAGAAVVPGGDRLFALLIVLSAVIALFAADVYLDFTSRDLEGQSRAAAARLKIPYDARSQAQVV